MKREKNCDYTLIKEYVQAMLFEFKVGLSPQLNWFIRNQSWKAKRALMNIHIGDAREPGLRSLAVRGMSQDDLSAVRKMWPRILDTLKRDVPSMTDQDMRVSLKFVISRFIELRSSISDDEKLFEKIQKELLEFLRK